MPRLKRHGKPETDSRPVVTDDFIYDDPDNNGSQPEPVSSDTPDEAMRKLRGRSDAQITDPVPESRPGASSESDHDTAGGTGKVYSSGIMLDDDLNPIGTTRKRSRGDHRILRGVILTLITLVLLFTVAAYIFHRLSPSTPVLGEPENMISRVMTPVQSFFSGLTEGVASYFRSMKLRSNIEAEYNALRAENEQLVYKAMLAEELQQTLSQYEDLSDEIKANSSMQPIICTVIGKSDSNYFSTFTINKGKNDGIDDYMAVTISGALVGYTENTQATKATVRTVIDSNASIAALI